MVQGSLFTFMKPRPTLVPPMVAGTSLIIQSNTIPKGVVLGSISASFPTVDIPSQWEFEGDDYGQAHSGGHLMLLGNKPINKGSQFVEKT